MPQASFPTPRTGNCLTPALPLDAAEARPADFRAKLGRSTRGIGARRQVKHRGRRLAALAAAIAVPAMAAPGDWSGFDPVEQVAQPAAIAAPMPFEQPGQSFPGSAFYWIAEEAGPTYDFASGTSDIAELGEAEISAEPPTELVAAGPAARAFRSGGGGVDRARALQCMTMAVHYEAASESIAGQRAVAQVVLNRVAHPSYPNSICGVVFQGSERRTGCQFSFTCDGSLARRPGGSSWRRAQGVAFRALSGEVFGGVGLATHYHTTAIYPYWAPSLHPVGTIGAHRFYRWRGAAGTPGAFRASYSGREPMASPKPRSSAGEVSPTAYDPVALARAYEQEYHASPAATAATAQSTTAPTRPAAAPSRAPAPAYSAQIRQSGGDAQFTAQNLPNSGGVKDEYAASGRWLRDPSRGPAALSTDQR